MSDVLPDETRLAADIERLKAEFPKTRELYREVCALLFFRFGITPTANRLYQLVKRGSMSTPTQVLSEFWTEMREKSRVRIEHPDLPAELQAAAGELVATLWTRSTASAQAALDALRTETEGEKVAARDAVVSLQAELGRTETALEQRTSALLAAQVRIRELEQGQAAGEAKRRALETEISRQQDEIRARDQALMQARGDFSTEIDKIRADVARAEDRLRAAEKHALLEIERERSQTSQLKTELITAGRRAEQRDMQHRADIEALLAQAGDARHQAGVLQGRLDAVEAVNAVYMKKLETLRQEAATEPTVLSDVGVSRRVPRSDRTSRNPRAVRMARTRKGKAV